MLSTGKNVPTDISSKIQPDLNMGDISEYQTIIDNVNTDIMARTVIQDTDNNTDDNKSAGKSRIYNSDYAPRYKSLKKLDRNADVYKDLFVDNSDNSDKSDKTHQHHNKWLPIRCNNLNDIVRNLKSILVLVGFGSLLITVSYRYLTAEEIDADTTHLFMNFMHHLSGQLLSGGVGLLLKENNITDM